MSDPLSRAARLANWLERTPTYGALLVIVALWPVCLLWAAGEATRDWWKEVAHKWRQIHLVTP